MDSGLPDPIQKEPESGFAEKRTRRIVAGGVFGKQRFLGGYDGWSYLVLMDSAQHAGKRSYAKSSGGIGTKSSTAPIRF